MGFEHLARYQFGFWVFMRFDYTISKYRLTSAAASLLLVRRFSSSVWNLRLSFDPGRPIRTQSQSTAPSTPRVWSRELIVPEPVSDDTRTSQAIKKHNVINTCSFIFCLPKVRPRYHCLRFQILHAIYSQFSSLTSCQSRERPNPE